MKRLYILYDAQCALCRHCKEWLSAQPRFLELVFLSFRSPELDYRFPGVRNLNPEEQLIVIADTGALYCGADAWVMCFYALKEYREWSLRLASPLLKPFARKLCHLISNNRQLISMWFVRYGDPELAQTLARAIPAEDVSCGVSQPRSAFVPTSGNC